MRIIQNLKFRIQNFKKGFTLIELLIVIAIIGVLATLLMVNFIGVRQRARDAQRKSDLRQIQSALEIYRSDQGSYPASIINCTCNGSVCFGAGGGEAARLYTCKKFLLIPAVLALITAEIITILVAAVLVIV